MDKMSINLLLIDSDAAACEDSYGYRCRDVTLPAAIYYFILFFELCSEGARAQLETTFPILID